MEQSQVDQFAAKLAAMEGKQVLKARMDEEGIVILFTDFSKKRFGHGYFSMFAEQTKPAAKSAPAGTGVPASPAGTGGVDKNHPTPPPASPVKTRKK